MAKTKVTISELQRDISRLVKRANEGETIFVYHYRSPVAVLGPIDPETRRALYREDTEARLAGKS